MHIFLILALGRNVLSVPSSETVIDVSVEPAMLVPQEAKNRSEPLKQIVSRSNAPVEKPLKDTNLESDTDSRADHEQIKRGDNGGVPLPNQGPSAPQEERAALSQQQSQQPQRAQKAEQKPKPIKETNRVKQKESHEATPPEPKTKPIRPLSSLRLDDGTLLDKFASSSPSTPVAEKSDPLAQNSPGAYKAFNRPSGTGALFLGSGGVADHLPNLPDGDITMLNAKANQYAGFVRRVAVQVFSQLRAQGWERLTAGEIRRIGDFTTVEAHLSAKGEFLGAQIVERSGSSSFDDVLDQAVRSGARDPNPPAGAQRADGQIVFIFKARSWAEFSANARNGAPVEHRWILLATGLE